MAAAAIVVVSGAVLFQTIRTRHPERDGAAHVTATAPARSWQTAPVNPVQDGGVVLRLLPQTRGAAAAIPVLTITSRDAVFDLQLDPNEFTRFQAALTDPATNAVVWRSEWLTPSTADPRSVRVIVPADRVKPQHYAFELLGSGAGGTGTAGSYTFEVIRP